jgi:hypothetical protein
MPYTFLHPGFVLPFARWFPRFLSIPALIMGSFVPDLDIIYRFSETRYHIFSYSTANILFELLPIGIILTYYFYMVNLPIIEIGRIDILPKNYWKHLKKLPQIVASVLLAISIHLFLDRYAHFNDSRSLSREVGLNLGYESSEFEHIYQILMYLPQILISGIGFILTVILIFINRKELLEKTKYLQEKWFSALIISGLVILSFTSMKIIKVGLEKEMQIDSILIGITCGLMSAFLLTPILLWILQRINIDSRITLPCIFIISIYMLGLPVKEFLSIYIIKGIFIVFISIISLTIIAYKENKGVVIFLILDFILSIFHPFTDYFTFLLVFKSILLVGLFFLKNFNKEFIKEVLIGLVYGSLISVAFYASNKGLGWGILFTMGIGLLYILSYSEPIDLKTRKWISFLPKVAAILLITTIFYKLGFLSFILLGILLLISIVNKKLSLKKIDDYFYYGIVPFLAILYVMSHFSILYGVFSACQILLLLTLVFIQDYRSKILIDEN